MRLRLPPPSLVALAWLFSFAPLTSAADSAAWLERLGQTQAANLGEIVAQQFETPQHSAGFHVGDPYRESAATTVHAWFNSAERQQSVCAVRFKGTEQAEYELRNFETVTAALTAGFTITHHGRCGTCSPLRDLAVYLATPNLTTPARHCARKFGLERKKRCFQQTIGFSEYCAESWAYNAQHTRQQCLGACISDYGLINLILNRYPVENTDESGELRPCLQCDEDQSGPGFQYSAGRTRRNSGIASAIRRKPDEIRTLDHTSYFGSSPPQ